MSKVRFLFAFLVLLNVGCIPLLFAEPTALSFSSSEINESSGIVKSRRYPNLFWTHNDSGDTARIFAIREDGKLVAEIAIEGAGNVDWEDIAMGEDGQMYLCDIGNNVARGDSDLAIYLIPEPNPETDKGVAVIRAIKFTYEGASQNAEACFFASKKLYILTKHRRSLTELYRLDPLKEEQVAEKISEYPMGLVTGADVSADGKKLAVLTYMGIHLFDKPKKNDNYLAGTHKMINFFFGQAEGIAFFNDSSLLITNEEGQLIKVPYK